MPLNGMHKNLFGLQIELIPVHIAREIMRIYFCGESCQEKKIF